jgi:hypothetical protein
MLTIKREKQWIPMNSIHIISLCQTFTQIYLYYSILYRTVEKHTAVLHVLRLPEYLWADTPRKLCLFHEGILSVLPIDNVHRETVRYVIIKKKLLGHNSCTHTPAGNSNALGSCISHHVANWECKKHKGTFMIFFYFYYERHCFGLQAVFPWSDVELNQIWST